MLRILGPFNSQTQTNLYGVITYQQVLNLQSILYQFYQKIHDQWTLYTNKQDLDLAIQSPHVKIEESYHINVYFDLIGMHESLVFSSSSISCNVCLSIRNTSIHSVNSSHQFSFSVNFYSVFLPCFIKFFPQVSSQLMEAVQQKVSLSQKLEDMEVDMQSYLETQVKIKLDRSSSCTDTETDTDSGMKETLARRLSKRIFRN